MNSGSLTIIGTFSFVFLISSFPLAQSGDSLTFSACASALNGKLYNQRLGDTPLKPCRKGDIAVNWSQSAPPAVYDATGKRVGAVLSLSDMYGGRIFVEIEEIGLQLGLSENQLFGDYGLDLFFNSSNCSGTPFLYPPQGRTGFLFPLSTVIHGGVVDMLYFMEPTTTPEQIVVNSAKVSSTGQCIPYSGATFLVFPATHQVNLSSLFTPPYSIH